jgi:hypothetical protein
MVMSVSSSGQWVDAANPAALEEVQTDKFRALATAKMTVKTDRNG